MKKSVYSICGMCAVRCPLRVEVEDGKVTWVEGNSHDGGMGTAICAKAAASIPFQYDDQRPQSPLIRDGARGSGKWKEVSWDEAYSYITDKLKAITEEHGAKSIMLTDRGGPFADMRKAFMKAIGSPNYINHDCTCGRNANHAAKSVLNMGRKGFNYDLKNAKHIILFGRNITESFKVKEVKNFMKAVKNGAHITYVDPRVTNTAAKATRYWKIKPGTDYALLLGITNYIVNNKLYDEEFVSKWVEGLAKLKKFLKPYTPEWAEGETEISADEIKAFCHEVNNDRPQVIFHIGWHLSRYKDTFYASRMLNILNGLMGNVEIEGGLIYPKTPGDAGSKGLKSLCADIPAVEDSQRCDGCDDEYAHYDSGAGMLQIAYQTIDTGKPYPIKAYIVHRHNPLIAMPDPTEQKRILDKLDLLVSVDVNYSETSWYSDVILPESTYLERDSLMRTEKGPKPGFSMRRKCVEPLYNSKPGWQIYIDMATLLGKGEFLPYKSIEDIWKYQLQDTDVKIEDFAEKGFVKLCDEPIGCDPKNIKFGTKTGKIEAFSQTWEDHGVPSFKPYETPTQPEGSYRLIFGRKGYQTHGQSHNNPVLNELLGSNCLWINTAEAKKIGISDGDMVKITNGPAQGTIKAKVTDFIHPTAVFMLHGFGTNVPAQKRAYGKGLADQDFMLGKLKDWDHGGGGLTLAEAFVTVTPAAV